MKKITALLLAVLMLISLSMYGCKTEEVDKEDEETEETNDTEVSTEVTEESTEVNYEDLPLLTAEEYVMASVEFDTEEMTAIPEAYKSARVSVSLDDLNALLDMIPEMDADAKSQIPTVKDIVVDIFSNSETMQQAAIIKANVNDNAAEVDLYMDMMNNKQVLASNLFEDVFLLTPDEEISRYQTMSSGEISRYMQEFVPEYLPVFCELLLKHSEETLTDNGKTVTVTMDISGEAIYNFVQELLTTLEGDEEFVEFFNSYTMAEITEAYYSDVVENFNESADETKAGLVDSGAAITMALEVDKLTYECSVADVTVTVEEESITIHFEGTDEKLLVKLDVPYEEVSMVLEAETDGENLTVKLDFTGADAKMDMDVVCEDGKFDASLFMAIPEYDYVPEEVTEVYDGEEYTYTDYVQTVVGTEETTVKLGGTYKADEMSAEIKVLTFAYNDLELELDEVGIAVEVEYGCTVPEAPATTKNYTDLDYMEMMTLMSNIAAALDIDMGYPEAEAEPEIYYDEDYYTEYEVTEAVIAE